MRDDDRRLDDEGGEGSGPSRGVTEAIRRLVVSGMGTLLTSEEGVRSGLAELKLPKEAVNYIMQQAEKTKAEVVKALGRELRGFLESIDSQTLVQKALTGLTIEVKAEISFKPSGKEGELLPVVKMETGSKDKEEGRQERRGAKRAKSPRRD